MRPRSRASKSLSLPLPFSSSPMIFETELEFGRVDEILDEMFDDDDEKEDSETSCNKKRSQL